MVNPSQALSAARQLLLQTALTTQETSEHLAKANSREYWRALIPGLGVEATERPGIAGEHGGISRDYAQVKDDVERYGYVHLDNVFSPALIERLRQGVERVREEGWPPVFAYVYDDFWKIACAATSRAVLENVLGPGYRQLPNLWIFRIDPRRGARGWPPHIDGDGRTDRSGRFTMWIPLTDASLDNGCIYLVPRDLATVGSGAKLATGQPFDAPSVGNLLQASCALPATAGSLLGWAFDVVHWGAACLGQGLPRISLSIEFISSERLPYRDEEPLLDPHQPVDFEQRLLVIARALLSYRRFEPVMGTRFAELAQQLVRGKTG